MVLHNFDTSSRTINRLRTQIDPNLDLLSAIKLVEQIRAEHGDLTVWCLLRHGETHFNRTGRNQGGVSVFGNGLSDSQIIDRKVNRPDEFTRRLAVNPFLHQETTQLIRDKLAPFFQVLKEMELIAEDGIVYASNANRAQHSGEEANIGRVVELSELGEKCMLPNSGLSSEEGKRVAPDIRAQMKADQEIDHVDVEPSPRLIYRGKSALRYMRDQELDSSGLNPYWIPAVTHQSMLQYLIPTLQQRHSEKPWNEKYENLSITLAIGKYRTPTDLELATAEQRPVWLAHERHLHSNAPIDHSSITQCTDLGHFEPYKPLCPIDAFTVCVASTDWEQPDFLARLRQLEI